MKNQFECIPCIVNSYLRLVETEVIPQPQQEAILRQLLDYLSRVDFDQSPPILGSAIHELIRESMQNSDPYDKIKQNYNHRMLDLYPSFKEMLNNSKDPFDTAMRLAIAGNVIDFGAKYQFDLMTTINKVIEHKLTIDDSLKLRQDLKNAHILLYIGDNCGEIVLDKLFLESISIPQKYFVVRESPVINDITLDDAKMIGIDEIASVITTGDNSPGAVWESASKDFKDHFKNADVVISKGQGNLEGLIDVQHEHIYFMLVVKCDLIAKKIDTQREAFIVKKGEFK